MTTRIIGGTVAAVALATWLRWGTVPVIAAFRVGVRAGRIQRSEAVR